MTRADLGDDGTLPISVVNWDSPRAADVAFTLRSWDRESEDGLPGVILADNPDIPLGGGMHGGLNRRELNHCLFLGGDSFRKGVEIATPSGTIDVSPTILKTLGLPQHPLMAGRPIEEAFAIGDAAPEVVEQVHEAGRGGYAQKIVTATVGGAKRPYLRWGMRTA